MNANFIFAGITSHMFISACLFKSLSSDKSEKIVDDVVVRNDEVENTDDTKESFFKHTLLVLKKLFCNKRYLVVILAYSLLSFLNTAPYNFLPDYISINSIQDEYSMSLSLIGVSSVIGQIAIGYLADKFVSLNWLIYSLCLIIAGFSTCILPFCKTFFLICIYSTVFGLMTSVNYVLQSNLVIEAVGLDNLTYAFGFLQAFQGLTTLTGTPAVAWLKDLTGSYDTTFFISGTFISLSGFSLLLWPYVSSKKI